ncbi:MAG: hypothetical protein E6I39_00760 [Chloroflexi bacterium]|nr:MAG: hypothetical protein E6I98_07715 [Chloroflexota bacterium]TMF02543.1 MAG: hypothetical protein E6I39_00760 [Chloroflexota bacterium]
MTRRLFGCVLLAAALAIAVSLPLSVAADSTATPYRQAVADALAIVENAQPGDVAAARHAAQVLTDGTGNTQPEVLSDLRESPPDFKDAASRLRAALDAIDNTAATSDPALAQSRLQQVMSMHRYDDLHKQPSFLERLSQWIQDRINEFLKAMASGIGPGGVVPAWVVYAIALAVMSVVAIVVFRSARGRLAGEFVAVGAGPQAPADYFAEADRLAARGDRVGAIRALCAAVAATLAGERTWEGSPLTVREIFRRAPDPASLNPLLRPFEAAVYGGRDVDEKTYEQGAAVAARFRIPVEKAA